MNCKVFIITNAMIRKPCYPNGIIPVEFPLCAKRESTLQTLDSQLKTRGWGNEQMKVIGHQNESVKQITLRPIPEKGLDE